jgi:hypothetical protein
LRGGKKKEINMKKIMMVAGLVVLLTGLVQAQTILINAINASVIETNTNGDVWNKVPHTGSANLVDKTGSPTTVDLAWTGTAQFPDNGYSSAAASPGSAVYLSPVYSAGYANGGYITSGATGQDATLLISGLTPGEQYTFSIFASRDATENRWTRWIATGAGSAVTSIVQTAGTGIGAGGINRNTDNLGVLSQTADGSGQVTITYRGNKAADFLGTGIYGYINAMAIESAPASKATMFIVQ